MNLDNYLRSVVKQNMLKYLNVCSCEKCGSTHNLDIHHDDMYFFEMVDKTLEDLNLPYHQEKNEYNESEIEKISIYILGLHMKSKYRILCEGCHMKEHKKNYKRRQPQLTGFDFIKARRCSGRESVAQKIVFWIEHKKDGEIFSVKELTDDLCITNKQFEKAKSKNKVLNDYFSTHLAEGFQQKYYVIDTKF